MPHTPVHLTDPLLDLAAEGEIPPSEREAVGSHLAACARCAAEVERRRELVAALAALPRFAPSAAFADGVMARVRVAPGGSAAALRRWLPRTGRGWAATAALLLTPGLPLVLFLGWFFARPGTSPAALGVRALDGLHDIGWSLALHTADALIRVGALRGLGWTLDAVAALGGATPVAIAGGALVPLTLWLVVRLARTPVRSSPHAY